jgi:GH25 family lysozyme M1 (1,4-beta-N-acetylmuramidase)
MMITFSADASSFQGTADWRAVKAAGYGGGTEKATQGTTYMNPFWPPARTTLTALASPSFTPGVYHYLTPGNGAAQADWFARSAGAIPGFVIWCDLERAAAGPSPAIADARDFVARVRQHYPAKRVGLYAGQSFTGSADLRFADMLWSPHYVAGTGTPRELYLTVPASWWDAYGGLSPVLLQFSQSAPVPGVGSQVDVSAFRGPPAQMHDVLLGIRPAPKPKPAREDAVQLNTGPGAVTPIAFRDGDTKVRLFPGSSDQTALSVEFNDHPTQAVTLTGGADAVGIPSGALGCRVIRGATGATVAVSAVTE